MLDHFGLRRVRGLGHELRDVLGDGGVGRARRRSSPISARSTPTPECVRVDDTRVSRSKPDRGLLHTTAELLNQDDEVVLSFSAVNVLLRRPYEWSDLAT